MITALSIIFLIIGLILWFVFGKDKKVVPVVSFYPPEDLTPFDVNVLLHNGGAESSEQPSMWLYLLQKKYLRLDENYNFVKEEVSLDEIEKMSEIEQFYYNVLTPDLGMLSAFSSYSGLFKSRNKYFRGNGWVRTFVVFLSFIYSCLVYSFVGVMVWGFNWGIVITLISRHATLKSRIVLFAFLVVFLKILIYDIFLIELGFDITIWEILISILTLTVLQILVAFMDTKNEIGNKYYGELLGFKDFLQKVEIPQFNELMQKDTDYFLKILPYAIELGIIHKDYRKELYQYLYESSEKQADAFVAVRKKTIEKQEK